MPLRNSPISRPSLEDLFPRRVNRTTDLLLQALMYWSPISGLLTTSRTTTIEESDATKPVSFCPRQVAVMSKESGLGIQSDQLQYRHCDDDESIETAKQRERSLSKILAYMATRDIGLHVLHSRS